jgi:hypothetical protein
MMPTMSIANESVRARGLGRRALRFAGWILFGLLVLELVARHYIARPFHCLQHVADPEMMFALRPGTYDSNGYMGRIPETRYVIGADGCQRVGTAPSLLVLGSSHAFGLGVDQRHAFPDLLRRGLAARGHAFAGTLNCSVPGHQMLSSLRSAEQALARAPHPVTVVLVNYHHLRQAFDWSILAPRDPVVSWFTEHLRLARVLYLYRLHRRFEAFPVRPESDARLGAGLDRFAGALRAARSRGVIVLHGQPEHPTFALAEEARRRGLAVVQVQPLPQDPTWSLDGEHWNARGHRHMAEELTGLIDAALRAPPPGALSD